MATVDGTKALISTFVYDPFGTLTSTTGQPGNTTNAAAFAWEGQHEKDTETSFTLTPIQMGARVYTLSLERQLECLVDFLRMSDNKTKGSGRNMQYKQNSLKGVSAAKALIAKVAAGIAVAVMLPLVGTAQLAFASGDASFSFSTTGGTTVGNTFTVTVSETSTSGDNVNGVQANVSYPTAQLQYKSMSLGAFTLCGQQTASGGQVDVGCASTSTVGGKQTIVSITFSVIAAGSGQVKMLSGSDIDNSSGQSVWNGTLTSATYTFSAASSGGSGGGSSGGGSTKKKMPPPASHSTGTSSGSKTQTTPSQPTTSTSQTPQTSTAPQPTTTPAATAAVTVTVTDSNGKPVKGAKVSVDGTYTVYSNASGVADFSGISTGNHTVTVSAAGKVTAESSLTLTANETKQVSLKLTAKKSAMTSALYTVLGLFVLGGGALVLLKLHAGGGMQGPQFPVQGIVVGSGTTPPTSTSVGPTVVAPPQTPGIAPPQVVPPAPQSPPGPSDPNGPIPPAGNLPPQ